MKVLTRQTINKNNLSYLKEIIKWFVGAIVFVKVIKTCVSVNPETATTNTVRFANLLKIVLIILLILWTVYSVFRILRVVKKRKELYFASLRTMTAKENSGKQYRIFFDNTDVPHNVEEEFFNREVGTDFWHITDKNGREIGNYPTDEYDLSKDDFILRD